MAAAYFESHLFKRTADVDGDWRDAPIAYAKAMRAGQSPPASSLTSVEGKARQLPSLMPTPLLTLEPLLSVWFGSTRWPWP